MSSKRCCCVFAMKKRGLGRSEAQYWTHDLTDPGAPLSTLGGKFKAVTVPKETDIGGRYRRLSYWVVFDLHVWYAAPLKGHMMIDFKNLIVGRHESKILFTWNLENGGAVLGAFLGIKDGIETILARDGITPALRTVLEEFRAIAAENNWDFAALRGATG